MREEAGVLVGHFHKAGDAQASDLAHSGQYLVQQAAEFTFPVWVQQAVMAVDLEVAGQGFEDDHAGVVDVVEGFQRGDDGLRQHQEFFRVGAVFKVGVHP